MDAKCAARRRRDVERRIQSGENLAGGEGGGAGGGAGGGLSIADDLTVSGMSVIGDEQRPAALPPAMEEDPRLCKHPCLY